MFRPIITYFPIATWQHLQEKVLPLNKMPQSRSCSHLSFRWELLALCRGLEVMLLLPVTPPVLVIMGQPELWAKLWIIVWASSASSTTSLISCSCWSLVLLLEVSTAAETEDCAATPKAHVEHREVGQNNDIQKFQIGPDFWVNYWNKSVALVYRAQIIRS